MATARAQRRWRAKYKYLKSRLNVMVHRLVHQDLAGIAQNSNLRRESDAAGLCLFSHKVFHPISAEHNLEALKLLEFSETSYKRNLYLYS